MKRFVKYWAIRLLGRELMAMPLKSLLLCIWLMISMFIIMPGSVYDGAPWQQTLLATINFIATGYAVIRKQQTNEI